MSLAYKPAGFNSMPLPETENDTLDTTFAEGDVALHLPDSLIINKGRERICFVHPHRPEYVIKVSRRKDSTHPANIQELRGYQLLVKKGKDLSRISHCHGFITTDRGTGLVCDCIRDFDGAISKTVWDMVVFEDDCDIEHLLAVLKKFCDFLIANHIWVFDINLKNIVLQKVSRTTLQPYIIDLKGSYVNHSLIPLARYVPYFARKKMIRRTTQLLQRVVAFRSRREELRLLD
jgi:hypothetical protein